MSGGFFRGTSADQDTRFSNKQAKLLKSQKFAPELENLVDMSKVKMDVIRPWIAKRVTELIGFEDEVLINFIYGLLEGKAVNGKEVQISLTGFMERNTGKFMKELWSLLLSAQQNISGVPQQFLDAKEEETKKKKAETERIANEIHRNRDKEKLEVEQEKTRMGGEDSISRDRRPELELDIKNDGRQSTIQTTEDREKSKRSSRRGHRDSRSPGSAHRSPSPPRKYSASPSKSSNPRSHSNERERSRSTSGPASSRSRSISSERNHHLGRERSATPPRRRNVRRSPSPWHTSLRSRRRSTSHSRYRSPTPTRHRIRSPLRRRSRTPVFRRSRSPIRRRSRSPVRVRSRSRTPIRRSLVRYRSRTPIRRRSPSPVRRRSSPVRRRSPSPVRRRSPSPVHRRSPSLVRRRSPYRKQHRSPSPSFVSRRSLSPTSSSPSPIHHQLASPTRHSSPSLHRPSSPARRRYRHSPSTVRQQSISPARGRSSLRSRKRSVTPVRQRSPVTEEFSSPSHAHHVSLSPIRRESMKSGRSPMRSSKERSRRCDNYSVHRGSSDGRAELPVENRKGVRSAESKLPIVSLRSPQRDTLVQDDLPGKNQDLSSHVHKSLSHVSRSASYSDERRSTSPHSSHGTHARADGTKIGKTQPISSDKLPDWADHKEHHSNKELSITSKATGLSMKGRESYDDEDARAKDKKISRADDSKSPNKLSQQESLPKLARKSELNDQNGLFYSPSKETNEGKVKEKRKRHKKLDSQDEESDDYSSYDSYEDRKEAKRRRKEEKKVKKEKRRRRREERRRRKEERRAEKLKLRSGDSGSSSSDLGQHHSEEDSVRVRKSQGSNIEETESEQKRLEIELRERALETLRAKKGLGN